MTTSKKIATINSLDFYSELNQKVHAINLQPLLLIGHIKISKFL